MKLKSLLLCGGMLAVTSTQAALTVTQRTLVLPTPAVTAMPTDGSTVVYLYNPSAQGYLRGANNYYTRASVSTTGGYKWKITVEDAVNNLVSLTDSVEVNNDGKPCTWGWRKMFADNANAVYVDNNNGKNCNTWVLTKVGDGETYKISNPSAAEGWLSVDKGGTTLSLIVDGAASDWYAVTPEEYAANIAKRPAILFEVFNASEALWAKLVEADALGINVTEWEAVYANAEATVDELNNATEAVKQAIVDFNASKATVDEPKDMSALIVNATFDKVGDFTGWKGDSFGAGGATSTCAERYNMNFDTWQQIDDMPVGVYQLSVQGFYRPNGTEGSWAAYKNGTDRNVLLYAANIKDDPADNDTLTSPITNIFYGIEPNNNSVSSASLATYVDGDDTYYLPNSMVAAVDYFNAGYYKDNKVLFPVTQGSAKIGVLKTVKAGTDWSIFDNFALTYYGNGADAYQLWNATLVKDVPSYNPETLLVTAALVEEYNNVKATAVGGTTYDEVMANLNAINAAKAAVEENIAAWAAYQEQIELAQKIMGDGNYNGEDLDVLIDYVELDAGDILTAKALTTEEIVAETAKLKDLRETAVQNSIKPGADVTNLLKNNDFSQGKTGWTFEAVSGGNVAANDKAKCAEAWNNANFDIYQTIENAAVGAYKVSVQGFYRRGRGDNAWKLYFNQTTGEMLPNVPETPAYAYLNNSKTPLANVFEYKVPVADNYYTGDFYKDPFDYCFPNNMADAGLAFDHGAYTINAVGVVAQKGDAMRIGMKGATNQDNDSWAIFTRFKLTYMGYDAEIIQPELEKTIAAVDLSKPMGADVAAQAKLLIEAGNAALATADGKEMFKALAAILAYNDSIDASVALFASLQTNLDDIENTIAESEAADDVKSKVAITVAEITDAMSTFTNADAEAAVATLADCRYKLALPAGYENATDAEPVNLTNLIQTPDFEKDGANSIEGWQNTTGYNFGNNDAQKAALCVEFYEKNFDMYQDITVPNGTYQVTVLAFDRQGNASTDYEEYVNGTPSLAQLYVKTGDTELFKPIEHLASDNNAASEAIGTGAETTYTNNDGVVFNVPNDMVSTRAYFDQGRYINGINVKVTDGKLRIGIRQAEHKTGSWVIMDEFRLWYLGTESTATEGGWNEVEEVEAAGETKKVDIYSVDGIKQNSLKKGVNIIVNTDAAGNANVRRFFVK